MKKPMSWLSTLGSTTMSSRLARLLRYSSTAAPVTNMASVESMNGAPRMAPTPTSLDACPLEKTIAMTGIIVSGRAVPTAARTDPIAPSASSSLWPNHSMPLVNSSAPRRITVNETIRTTRSKLNLRSRARRRRA